MMGFAVYNMIENNTTTIEKASLKNYDLLLKVPLALPYLSNWESTEISDEELLKGNEYYRVVSKKIVNDTLFVECAFSQTSRERFWSLVSTFDDLVKSDSDTHKGAPASILKNFLKEYMALGQKHIFYVFEYAASSPFHYYIADILSSPESSIPSPPPDLI
jgi:hypothetical protein